MGVGGSGLRERDTCAGTPNSRVRDNSEGGREGEGEGEGHLGVGVGQFRAAPGLPARVGTLPTRVGTP